MKSPVRDARQPRRILAVCAIDLTASKLLRPWFLALLNAGYEVHIACERSTYFEQLSADGFRMHHVPIRRKLNPLRNIRALMDLCRLMRRERFIVVNTHSPVAAALGRIAARIAGVPGIVYTVHGFYFHDDMPPWKRRVYIAVEWLLGKMTDEFMFVSDEDRQTALREGIASNPARAMTIFNGVDLNAFPSRHSIMSRSRQEREKLGISARSIVVGVVGRVVREKGYMEFAEMARQVAASGADVFFLVVGDALPSDRDGIVSELKAQVESDGLTNRFRFAGFTDRVPEYLQAMDIFVLPSYREGFPRSVLEAMSTGLPVVATNIRGCREAVVNGETGLIVPPKDASALAAAVTRLVLDSGLRDCMGQAGRTRAERLYSQETVQRRFLDTIEKCRTLAAKNAGSAYAADL